MGSETGEDIQRKTVVVVGGGFGGLSAINMLLRKRKQFHIVLINQADHFIYTPSLWQFEVFNDAEDELAIDLQEFCNKRKIEFVHDTVKSIDVQKRSIECQMQHLAYDYLILTPGSKTNYFGIQGLEENSLKLKTAADFKAIKAALLGLVSRHQEAVEDEQDKLRIVVGGGGLTGIETAIGCTLILQNLMKKKLTDLHFEIVIVEGGEDILAGFPKKAMQLTKKYLAKHSISLRTNAKIQKVEKGKQFSVSFPDSSSMKADVIIWTGGVAPNDCYSGSGLEMNDRKCICVNEFLQAKNSPEVFSAGDCAFFYSERLKKPIPMKAHWAMVEGKHAARNVMSRASGKPMRPFAPGADDPTLIGLGEWDAVFVWGNFVTEGFLMALLKKSIEKYILWKFR